MNEKLKATDRCLQIIRFFEGFVSTLYLDKGKLAIGIGHQLKPGETFTKITEKKAFSLLKQDIKKFENHIKEDVKVELNQDQFDALISFAFNIGETSFRNSTLIRLLNAKNYVGAANEFPKWNKSGGKVLSGLIKRRNVERALFLSQQYTLK